MGNVHALWKSLGEELPDSHLQFFNQLLIRFGAEATFRILPTEDDSKTKLRLQMDLHGQKFNFFLDEPPLPNGDWPGMFNEIQSRAESHLAKQRFGLFADDYLRILHGARQLLSGLMENSGGRGRPPKGQGRKEGQSQALTLLHECCEYEFPPPPELVTVFEICSGITGDDSRNKLTSEQEKALAFELDGNWKLEWGEGWFTDVSSEAVASHLGQTDDGRNVRNWRCRPLYRQSFIDGLLAAAGK